MIGLWRQSIQEFDNEPSALREGVDVGYPQNGNLNSWESTRTNKECQVCASDVEHVLARLDMRHGCYGRKHDSVPRADAGSIIGTHEWRRYNEWSLSCICLSYNSGQL